MSNNDTPENTPPKVIIYEADGAMAKISVRLEGETVWLTNLQLAQLFQCTNSPSASISKTSSTVESYPPIQLFGNSEQLPPMANPIPCLITTSI